MIKNQPVNYVYNRRDIVVGNINEKALLLAPAERADVVVDFSQFAGKTLILYNDAPAPVPAADPRLDYYTGDPGSDRHRRCAVDLARLRPQHPHHHADPGTTAPPPPGNYGSGLCQPDRPGRLRGVPADGRAAVPQERRHRPQQAYDTVYGTTTTVGAVNFSTIQGTEMTFAPIGQAAADAADGAEEPSSRTSRWTTDA